MNKHAESIDALLKGALVFGEHHHKIYRYVTGCRKCNKRRGKANYCFECGSKLTDKFKVKVGVDITRYRLRYSNGTLLLGVMKTDDICYRETKSSSISLDFFLKLKNVKWE